jgi:hypothetical protein
LQRIDADHHFLRRALHDELIGSDGVSHATDEPRDTRARRGATQRDAGAMTRAFEESARDPSKSLDADERR